MQPYNENRFHQHEKSANSEDDTNTGTWILICIILALINVILGFL